MCGEETCYRPFRLWPIANIRIYNLGWTHKGRVTHKCVSILSIIVSVNVFLSSRRQTIFGINAGILLIGSLWTNFSEIIIEIHTYTCLWCQWNNLAALQWRHNERYGVSNHRPLDCLPNRCTRVDQRKHQSSASLASVRGIHRSPQRRFRLMTSSWSMGPQPEPTRNKTRWRTSSVYISGDVLCA